MAVLTRPEVPPGPRRDLVDALHRLHHEAGRPSLRTLATEAGCSHTTVSSVFSSPRLPTWGVLELVVEALHGDTEEFRRLWLAVDGHGAEPTGQAMPSMAGRTAEQRVLRRHLGAGAGLLLIAGEAGVGKTKLVDVARSSPEVFVARGAGLPLSIELPLFPVATALRQVYELDRGQWIEEALANAAPYLRGALSVLLPEVGTPEAPVPESVWSQQRLFTAVAVVLRELAALRPLGVLFEDLHWADPATLDLVEHLAAGGTGVPLLGTYRIDDPSIPAPVLDWYARVRRLPTVDVIELRPLSRAETADLIAMLGGPRRERDVDAIFQRSQGLPLYVEQLAAHVPEDQPLPSLLADLLDQRVRQLADDERAIVAALAVADRALSGAVLERVTELSSAGVNRAVRSLDTRRLLAATKPDVALRHPLLAESVRHRLVGSEDADLHRRLALTLAAGADADPGEVAKHWRGAGDAEQELVWQIRTAEVARARMAFTQEGELWLRVLELWPDDADLSVLSGGSLRRVDVQLAAMDALQDSAHTERAHEHLGGLLERAGDLPPVLRAEVYRRAAQYLGSTEGHEVGLPYALEAVAILGAEPPGPSLIEALLNATADLRALDRRDEALAMARRALGVALEIGDRGWERRLRASLAATEIERGDVAAVRALIDQGWAIALPSPDPVGDVWLGVIETDLVLKLEGTPAEMNAASQRALASAADWDLETYYSSILRSNAADGLLLHGAVAAAAELLDPVTADKPHQAHWSVHSVRVGLDVVRGRIEEAVDRAELLDQLRIPNLEAELEFHDKQAWAELWSARPEAAHDRLVRLLTAVAPTDQAAFAGPCLALAARAAADIGDVRLAGELEQLLAGMKVDPFAVRVLPVNGVASGASWRAELTRLANAPAVEPWAHAAREWARLGRPFDSAYCRWRGAQAALATSQGALAQRLLSKAAAEAREHVPLSDAIRAIQR